LQQSYGLMVNYLYDLDYIEQNHEAYAQQPAGALADWEARLAEAGVAIESRVKWRRGESIYFRDPDGHVLELATPGLWPGY